MSDMVETMYSVHAAGLAAPQVGVPLRIIVVRMPDEGAKVVINPEVVRSKGERLATEACFSVPGHYGEVKRAASVTVKGLDQNWKEIRIKADGLVAQALQHEIDHLDGVLYVEHLESPDHLYQDEPAPEGEGD